MIITMKHVLIFFAAALFYSAPLFAQKTTFGVRAGVNISKWNFAEEEAGYRARSKAGLEAGFLADIKLSKQFSLQPELLYSRYGTGLASQGESVKYNVNYLVIPVLAKYSLRGNGLSFLAGPQVGFLLSANYKYQGTKNNLKEYLNATNFFAVLGADYTFPIGISVGARYNFSLGEIQKEGETKVRENSFGISAGYNLSRLFTKSKGKK
jgi:hypothetical protein